MSDMEDAMRLFTWPDYLIFGLTLLISSLIGVYYACKGGGSSTSDYLMGGRKMTVFPIAMSLTASTLSAASLLGIPTDIYLTGIMYFWVIVSMVLCIPVASYLILPVFHNLQVISANQYLELRFNRFIRRFASLLYFLKTLIFLSMVVYGPALAFQQVSGVDVTISIVIMFVICTFYTSIGGIKAVVWTDTIQVVLMYGAIISISVKGVIDVGGLGTVWERNLNSSRLDLFDFDPDPTIRSTVWSLVIGGFFYWCSWFGIDQAIVQRFLTMPTAASAQKAMWANALAISGIILISGFIGLLIYAKYFDCDPITASIVQKADQIVPFYVMETVGNWPGLPGLFVAGIFSGALSSLSSVMNAMALIVLEDFIRPFFPNLEERTATWITKGVSVLVGLMGFGMVFIIANVKQILEAVLSLDGAAAGSLLGVFTLGMFVPWANAIGAGVGMVTSFSLMMWLGIANQMAKSSGLLPEGQLKPVSTENCPFPVNTTSSNSDGLSAPEEEVLVLLRLSFWWYTLMGMLIVWFVGTLVSFLSGRQDPTKLNPKLLCHLIRPAVHKMNTKVEESTGMDLHYTPSS